jgi:hypothetical protein
VPAERKGDRTQPAKEERRVKGGRSPKGRLDTEREPAEHLPVLLAEGRRRPRRPTRRRGPECRTGQLARQSRLVRVWQEEAR